MALTRACDLSSTCVTCSQHSLEGAESQEDWVAWVPPFLWEAR